MTTIAQRDLLPLLVPIPSISEQERIVCKYDELDELTRREEHRVQKLRTLKQGLMDDLLTGRVRVPTHDLKEAMA